LLNYLFSADQRKIMNSFSSYDPSPGVSNPSLLL
jgi:hypothetical protein